MPTEPQPPTLSQVVRRAVEICDPGGRNEQLAEYMRRFEDRDEPIAGVEDVEAEAFGAARAGKSVV